MNPASKYNCTRAFTPNKSINTTAETCHDRKSIKCHCHSKINLVEGSCFSVGITENQLCDMILKSRSSRICVSNDAKIKIEGKVINTKKNMKTALKNITQKKNKKKNSPVRLNTCRLSSSSNINKACDKAKQFHACINSISKTNSFKKSNIEVTKIKHTGKGEINTYKKVITKLKDENVSLKKRLEEAKNLEEQLKNDYEIKLHGNLQLISKLKDWNKSLEKTVNNLIPNSIKSQIREPKNEINSFKTLDVGELNIETVQRGRAISLKGISQPREDETKELFNIQKKQKDFSKVIKNLKEEVLQNEIKLKVEMLTRVTQVATSYKLLSKKKDKKILELQDIITKLQSDNEALLLTIK